MFKKEKYFPLIMIPIAVSAIIIVGNYLNDGFAITFLPLAAILIFSSEIFRKEKKNPKKTRLHPDYKAPQEKEQPYGPVPSGK